MSDWQSRRGSGPPTTFAGSPALDLGRGTMTRLYVFSRRRMIQLYVSGGSDELLKQLETVLAPTFAKTVVPWEEDVPKAEEKKEPKAEEEKEPKAEEKGKAKPAWNDPDD